MKRLATILIALVAAWRDAPSCGCDSDQGRKPCNCRGGKC